MTYTTITIRKVNKDILLEFKSVIAKEGKNMGEGISEAISLWLGQRKKIRVKKIEDDELWKKMLSPVDYGIETDASKIDETIYGEV